MPILTSLHAIESYLKSAKPAYALYYCQENARTVKVIQLATQGHIPLKKVNKNKLKQLGTFHCALEIPQESLDKGQAWLKQQLQRLANQAIATVLVLDGITDPHNLGAMLRSCALFDVDLVLYPQKRSAQGDTDTVHRVSTGAVDIVPHGAINNLSHCLGLFKEFGFWVYGTDMQGQTLPQEQALPDKIVFIIGSEGQGMSTLVRKNCDATLTISTTGRIDSLNASVACGILLYHRYISKNNL